LKYAKGRCRKKEIDGENSVGMGRTNNIDTARLENVVAWRRNDGSDWSKTFKIGRGAGF
jgi:hypothetical protein